ncbi:MAG: hypothetical protein A2Y14_02910 [Verrucomicrobia bacterium GWF2_51_19]|nr:MAG: hypothetical protein A2Y14_02910 [Verrucomicrobia bacterium GWF2_51_19]HCJ11820.1 ferredoxin [Opitutae bacterium]
MSDILIFFDCESYSVPQDITILEAAERIGKAIPHICSHPKLSVSGNCRSCLVEVALPDKDNVLQWQPTPVLACSTKVQNGMHVRTQSEMVRASRESVMEFLFAQRPLDCTVCDKAGDCSLQNIAFDYGRSCSRFHETKIKKPKQIIVGPRLILDAERCILCSLCVRFCKEVLKKDLIAFSERGSATQLVCAPQSDMESNYWLNMVDICPAGALVDSKATLKPRPWLLKKTPSISTESSVGVNIDVWSREGTLYAITPRRNDFVNDTWMPDSAREAFVDKRERCSECRIRGAVVTLEEAVRYSAQQIKESGGFGIVGSSFLSLEEQFLLKKLLDSTPSKLFWLKHEDRGDGFLVSDDRTPNLNGAFLSGLLSQPPDDLNAIKAAFAQNTFKTWLVFYEDIATWVDKKALDGKTLIYCNTHSNKSAKEATVLLPALTVFEQAGCFVNRDYRLQKFLKAVERKGVPSISDAIKGLLSHFNITVDLWPTIQAAIPALQNTSFDEIPLTGIQLKKSDKSV